MFGKPKGCYLEKKSLNTVDVVLAFEGIMVFDNLSYPLLLISF
jgi:hypothetical protein